MTEDEARTKWCPFARVVERQNDQSYNRCVIVQQYGGAEALPIPIGAKCVASECACWVVDAGATVPPGEHSTAQGHCGLINWG